MLSTVKLIEKKALLLHVKVGEWVAGRAKSAVSEQARKRHAELMQDLREIFHLVHSLRGQMPASEAEATLQWPKVWAGVEKEMVRQKKQDPSITIFLLEIGDDAPGVTQAARRGWIRYPKCLDKLWANLGI